MSEYFVKQSYGKIWHFCHNSQGICFCTMTDHNLTSYEVLLPEGQEDFDVLIDNADCIHLVCQNENGDILYLYYNQKEWRKTTVLQSKNAAPYPKLFHIERVHNWINLLYVIDYKGKKMLAHQILDSGEESPSVLDYVRGKFTVAQDSMNNLYVLYFSESSRCLGIRKYAWSKKEWEPFEELTAPMDFSNPYLYIDRNDQRHIVGTSGSQVLYLGEQPTPVGEGKQPLILEKEHLYVVWYQEKTGNIMANYSDNGGRSFQGATEFMAGRFSAPKQFSISYTRYETEYRAKHCYGYIGDSGVKLYLLNEFFLVAKKPPKPIEKNIAREADEFARQLSPAVYQARRQERQGVEVTKLKLQLDQMTRMLEQIQRQIAQLERKIEE